MGIVLTRRNRSGFAGVCFGVVSLSLVAGVASIVVGAVTVPVETVWRVIGGHLWGSVAGLDPIDNQIVWDLRVPRAALGFVVGAGLATVGAVIQCVVRNPLGDPYLLGIMSGASTGAVTVIVLGSGAAAGLSLNGAAFAGAIAAFVLTYVLARDRGRLPPTRLVLAGVAVGYLFSAVTFGLQVAADPNEIRRALFWTLGSLSGARWSDLGLPAAVVGVCTLALATQGRRLNALAMGDDTAGSLGLHVVGFQVALMSMSALVTAVIVAVAGGIGFVGLMIPHIARLLVGADHRRVLILSALLGGTFLQLCDIAARMVLRPVELPIGIITAAVGAPFFLWLLRSRPARLDAS